MFDNCISVIGGPTNITLFTIAYLIGRPTNNTLFDYKNDITFIIQNNPSSTNKVQNKVVVGISCTLREGLNCHKTWSVFFTKQDKLRGSSNPQRKNSVQYLKH